MHRAGHEDPDVRGVDLHELRKNWHDLGEKDPLWAVLTYPGKEAGRWDVGEFFETGRREIGQLLAEIESIRPGLPRGRALDFGCGVGRLSRALADHFDEVDGVDIAHSMIRFAREHNPNERCRFVVNERDDLALFPDSSFDLVYSNMVLQHMEPRYAKKYVTEFIRILRPRGLAVFQIPASRTPRDRWKDAIPRSVRAVYVAAAYRRKGRPVMEMYATPRRDVEALVRRADGSVVDARRFGDSRSWVNVRYAVEKAHPPTAGASP